MKIMKYLVLGWPVAYKHTAAEELNSGQLKTNPNIDRVEDHSFIQGPSGLKSSALNLSATPPPLKTLPE